MAKINQDAFNQVSKSANLKQQQSAIEIDTVRLTSVYNIPKSWIALIKNNKVSISDFLKQSLFEKLKRDNMI